MSDRAETMTAEERAGLLNALKQAYALLDKFLFELERPREDIQAFCEIVQMIKRAEVQS